MANGQAPESENTVLIGVVDDHPLVREALVLAIAQAEPRAELVAVANLGALKSQIAAFGYPPALILLDLDLGEGSDFANLVTLVREFPGASVAMVSATETPSAIAKGRDLGASGYLFKSAPLEQLSGSVRSLLNGEWVFPDSLAEANLAPSTAEAVQRLATLTPTQAKVLDGLRKGLLNKQIAYELGISLSTTKAHMTAIFKKLGVQNRTQALLVAQEMQQD